MQSRKDDFPANKYVFKVNNRNTRKHESITTVLLTVVPVSSLLTLNIFHTFFSISGNGFEYVYVCWVSMSICMSMESYKVIEALIKFVTLFENSKIAARAITLPSQLILIGSRGR